MWTVLNILVDIASHSRWRNIKKTIIADDYLKIGIDLFLRRINGLGKIGQIVVDRDKNGEKKEGRMMQLSPENVVWSTTSVNPLIVSDKKPGPSIAGKDHG